MTDESTHESTRVTFNHNFRAIKTFVNDLGETFASDNHSLALYERLINKTELVHTEAIDKHIASFRAFLSENEENIINRKLPFINKITYSPKVFIDMNDILNIPMDDETKTIIWRHLITLLALIGNNTKARDVLKEKAAAHTAPILEMLKGESKEDDFVNKIIAKVGQKVNFDTMTDPQAAMTDMLSSGLVMELVTNLQEEVTSGNLDIQNLRSSMMKLVSGIVPDAQNNPALASTMNMLNIMGAGMP